MVIICLHLLTRMRDINQAINARHKERCEQRKWLLAAPTYGFMELNIAVSSLKNLRASSACG